MQVLQRSDLYTLEAYSNERTNFRARVLAHKQVRKLHLGEHLTLLFEDRLTIQYQIQEMLRIERIFEAAAIQCELDVYNPLIPDGNNHKVTVLIEFPDAEMRRNELTRLRGIEHAIYAEVSGHGRIGAHANEDMERADLNKTAAVHYLRFQYPEAAVSALRSGAALIFGIDDPRMPIRVEVTDPTRYALLADFHSLDFS